MYQTAQRPRLLIAEDDKDEQELLEIALKSAGLPAELQFAEDGVSLLEILESDGRPGLILLDLNMPRLDGRNALMKIKESERHKGIPVVVLTSSNHERDVDFAYRQGAASFITKPSSFKELEELAKTLCDYWYEVSTLPDWNA